MLKLIHDLGIHKRGAYKARFGIYECPVCKRHVEANTYNVTVYDIQRCSHCKRADTQCAFDVALSGDVDAKHSYVAEIQAVLGTELVLAQSIEAQDLCRIHKDNILRDVKEFGSANVTARLRTTMVELNFIFKGIGSELLDD